MIYKRLSSLFINFICSYALFPFSKSPFKVDKDGRHYKFRGTSPRRAQGKSKESSHESAPKPSTFRAGPKKISAQNSD
jgi:hypothetical protein